MKSRDLFFLATNKTRQDNGANSAGNSRSFDCGSELACESAPSAQDDKIDKDVACSRPALAGARCSLLDREKPKARCLLLWSLPSFSNRFSEHFSEL